MQQKSKNNYKSYIGAMRLNRWPRSFSIIVGVIAAIYTTGFANKDLLTLLINFLLAFVVTFLICITNYIINEIVDAPTDAFHPIKHNRPVASDLVSIKILLIIAVAFTFIAFLITFKFFSIKLAISLLSLLVMGLLYNINPIRLKDIIYIDAISESANNPIRFLIGWYCIGVNTNPPISYLICWWAIGSFLMFGKRLSEKRIFHKDEAKYYRKSLGIYTEASLVKSMIISSITFLIPFFYMIIIKLNIYTAILLPLSAIYIVWILLEAWKGKYLIDEPEVILKQAPFIILIIILLIFVVLSIL